MKKKENKFMRLASMVMVGVLATTSIVGGTFAKYTTQDSASDMARVAKWGVELQVVGDLYGDTYKDTIIETDDETMTVQSVDAATNNTAVVAPGTKNDNGFTFSLKGQPEVDGTVTTTMKIQNVFLKAGSYGIMIPVDATVVTEANFDEQGDLYTKSGDTYTKATAYSDNTTFYTLEDAVTMTADYYPVVYTLAGNTATSGTDAEDTLEKAADAIANQLGLTAGTADTDTSITYTGTKAFSTNENLATWLVDGETLTWAWAFTDDAENDGDSAVEHDKADTILGLLQTADLNNGTVVEGTVVKASGDTFIAPTEYEDYCLDTMFSIDITATQVD